QNQLALLYQEARQSSDPLSSPDQVFTPSSSGLSSQSFDFSFTTAPQHLSPNQHATRPSPGLFPGRREPSATARRPPDVEISHDNINIQNLSATHIAPPPLPPFKPPPKRQSSEEFICMPPYTPRLGGGSFMFGDETFKTDHSNVVKMRQTLPASIGPSQHCRKRLYETLPPTPDSPGSDECILMALPEIRGPLYVDVPHFPFHNPPEGLLTPEASPTKKPCLSFFPREDDSERERLEISLLAQYISTLAEGFCHSHPQNTSAPPHHGPNSSLAHIDVFMFEEKAVDGIPLPNLQSTSPVPPSPYSSEPSYAQHSPSRSSPVHAQEEAATLNGVRHLCSVQSTHRNRMAGGGTQEAERPEVEMMTSSGSAEALPALTPALPCAQSLLEELVTMEPVFGAAAPMTPAERQQDELYQLPHQGGQQIFYQDGTSDHMF
ncbi:hypothetical protein M9458_042041, partial [Cirrhinus mrigala]